MDSIRGLNIGKTAKRKRKNSTANQAHIFTQPLPFICEKILLSCFGLSTLDSKIGAVRYHHMLQSVASIKQVRTA